MIENNYYISVSASSSSPGEWPTFVYKEFLKVPVRSDGKHGTFISLIVHLDHLTDPLQLLTVCHTFYIQGPPCLLYTSRCV